MQPKKIIPPLYFNIDEWLQLRDINTGGTRSKAVYVSPDNIPYYFKTSINKDKRNYPFEFWSEIIASQLGKLLQLPVLEYHISTRNDKIGCLSKSMIELSVEELIDGVNLILQFEPNFKEICKTEHYFWKIERVLKNVGLLEYRRIAVEMVLFDCIIGNTDRHSENWALIRNKRGEDVYSYIKKMNWIRRIIEFWIIHRELKIPFFEIPKLVALARHRFAPFFDNGSSLGRELSEEKLSRMLKNDTLFDNFFSGGTSDIIVNEGKKKSFLETIDYLLETYPDESVHFFTNHLSYYNKDEWEKIVDEIDNNYPTIGFETSRISKPRKDFVVKLIDERVKYIKDKVNYYGHQIRI